MPLIIGQLKAYYKTSPGGWSNVNFVDTYKTEKGQNYGTASLRPGEVSGEPCESSKNNHKSMKVNISSCMCCTVCTVDHRHTCIFI